MGNATKFCSQFRGLSAGSDSQISVFIPTHSRVHQSMILYLWLEAFSNFRMSKFQSSSLAMAAMTSGGASGRWTIVVFVLTLDVASGLGGCIRKPGKHRTVRNNVNNTNMICVVMWNWQFIEIEVESEFYVLIKLGLNDCPIKTMGFELAITTYFLINVVEDYVVNQVWQCHPSGQPAYLFFVHQWTAFDPANQNQETAVTSLFYSIQKK